TVIVAWSNGFLPDPATALVEARLLDAGGLPPVEVATPGAEVEGPEGRPPPLEWVGTYRNGEKIVVLKRQRDGLAFFDGVRDLPVVPLEGDRWGFRLPDGRTAPLTFRLVEAGGRRFVLMNGRAHARQQARLP
ncbi:MAG TPA: hypothetical protein VE173_06125, partial [Longimicrobiales bacterium]|nr:hypothetical protein [Longimicrobiales bacterium]